MDIPNIEEYKTIVEQTSSLSDRRQVTNDIYVALNTLFLTGVAYFLTTTHLKSWWPAIILGVVTLISWVINGTWMGLLEQYRELIKLRYTYLKQLEGLFPIKGADIARGIYHAEQKLYDEHHNFDFTKLELRLARLFLILYPTIAIVVAILTYLISQGILSTPIFN